MYSRKSQNPDGTPLVETSSRLAAILQETILLTIRAHDDLGAQCPFNDS